MAKPRLYGIPGSRALRSIWAIEETGIEYELVKTHFIGDSKKPDYLAINPNGRVPALVDGDLTLFESMAINLYLAQTYGGDLYPTSDADRALAIQWSFWGMTEIEPPLMQMLLHKILFPEEQRRPEVVTEAETTIERPLRVLEAHLARRDTMLGGDFSIADLNVASVLSMSNMVGYGLGAFPNVQAWLGRCVSRPAMARAQKADT
jgi:glutathione S-transferase